MKLQNNYNISQNTSGEIELLFKNKHGQIVDKKVFHNIIKIYMKDHIAHTLPYPYVWDPTGGTGSGDWVTNDVNRDLFFPKYIIIGAAYDTSTANYGAPLNTNDTDYYKTDPISGQKVPITLYSGDTYNGLIKAIPINVSNNIPLKRIENISFDATYQPPGTPYLRSDVRAMYNIVSFKTTLTTSEYNGFGGSYTSFDICELALVSGPAFDSSVSDCDCDPHTLFMMGDGGNYDTGASAVSPIDISIVEGSNIITLANASNANYIYEGDQIKLISTHSMISEYYLVMNKSGATLTLDRVPKDDTNTNLPSGNYTMWVDRFRMLAHSILPQPFSKTSALEVDITWKIYFS